MASARQTCEIGDECTVVEHSDYSAASYRRTRSQLDGFVHVVSQQRRSEVFRQIVICIAACSAILCAWLLLAEPNGSTNRTVLSLDNFAVSKGSDSQLDATPAANAKAAYDVNDHLDHRQSKALSGMFANEFTQTEREQHAAEDEEKRQLMSEDKREEARGLAHLEHDEIAKMTMAAKAASSQLSDYAAIYGNTLDHVPVPRPHERQDSAKEQESAARAASDQLSQYASIYGNLMGSSRPVAASTKLSSSGEQPSGMEGLVEHTESAIKRATTDIAAYMSQDKRHKVAAQELKDILDGSLFQVRSVQDELSRPRHPTHSALARSAAQQQSSLKAAAPDGDGFPSISSMERKFKAWEAVKHSAQPAAAIPRPETGSAPAAAARASGVGQPVAEAAVSKPVEGALRAMGSAEHAAASAVGSVPPAPAPASPQGGSIAPPAVAPRPLTACEEVARAYGGRTAEMEGACGKQPRCHFDFAAQSCRDS